MGDDDETYLHATYASHFDMDEAFCARMRRAIEAGLESAPIGVITTPGTRKIQNTFQQSKTYASATAATFGFSRGRPAAKREAEEDWGRVRDQ